MSTRDDRKYTAEELKAMEEKLRELDREPSPFLINFIPKAGGDGRQE